MLPAYAIRINQQTNPPAPLFPMTPRPRPYDNVNATPQPPSNPRKVSLNRACRPGAPTRHVPTNPWQVSLSRAVCPLAALVTAWSWDVTDYWSLVTGPLDAPVMAWWGDGGGMLVGRWGDGGST